MHGHAVGDRVLRAAAERMRGALRPTDTIGRIGGDEFVVILKSLPHEVPAEEIAHRLAQAVAAPVAFEDGIVNVRASIGQASTDDPDFPAARLLGAADANMYKVEAGDPQRRGVRAASVRAPAARGEIGQVVRAGCPTLAARRAARVVGWSPRRQRSPAGPWSGWDPGAAAERVGERR